MNVISKHNNQLYITVLLTVHNEEELIEKRIKNIIEMNYPHQLLEVLVASDGSVDNTNNIVKALTLKDPRIKLFETKVGGKSATQNAALPISSGEIIILTDAAAIFTNKDTINNLVSYFRLSDVGCVTGKVILVNTKNAISESQGYYWKYEMFLRKMESQIGILHTASGQIMAFRKNIFKPFEDIYGDDCVIPLDILRQGYRIIHEDSATAYDTMPASIKGEFKARSRMTLRNITGTLSRYSLLNPTKHPLIFISIVSHKLLRWLTPFFMISFLILNILIINKGDIYIILLCGQISFYLLGIIGLMAEMHKIKIPLTSQVFSFLLANCGFFVGVCKAVIGKKITFYKKQNP